MDTIVQGCVIEHEALEIEKYGEEILFAGWNPQLALARENPLVRTGKHIRPPADLLDKDIDAWLKKMYEYQC